MISEKTIAKYDRLTARAFKAAEKAAKAKAREIVKKDEAEIVTTVAGGRVYQHRAIGLPCGWCDVTLDNARSGFAQYAKYKDAFQNSIYRGPRVWWWAFGERFVVHPKHPYLKQSMEVNEAAAEAFADVLRKGGVPCGTWSTID